MSRLFTTLALTVFAGIMFSTGPVMAKGWMKDCKADWKKHCKGKKGDEAKECLKTAEGVSDKCKKAMEEEGGMEKKDGMEKPAEGGESK